MGMCKLFDLTQSTTQIIYIKVKFYIKHLYISGNLIFIKNKKDWKHTCEYRTCSKNII